MSNRSLILLKVEGRASDQRYEESSWNDQTKLEKLGDERWDFPSGRRRMILFRYGISKHSYSKKTYTSEFLAIPSGSRAVSLRKVKTTRGENRRMAADFWREPVAPSSWELEGRETEVVSTRVDQF